MEEIWKDIQGYEGMYQVSNLGRVRSLNYNKTKQIKLLALSTTPGGYQICQLSKNGKRYFMSVHRLVYTTFIGSIPNEIEVNHIDENKTNNCITNLNLMTRKENVNWGSSLERRSITQLNKPNSSKQVICVETGIEYPSAREAERQLNLKKCSVSTCANPNHSSKTAGGYHWEYKKGVLIDPFSI